MSTALSRRTASVILYQGDDFERLAELRQEADIATALAEQAARDAAPRAGDDEPDSETAEVARRKQAVYDAFVDEAAERAVEVRLRAMRGKLFRKLVAEHPPRDDHDMDESYRLNTDTFPLQLLLECIEEPQMSAGAREEFIEDLSDGDYERLWITAYWLNRGTGGDPKATRYSVASPSSDVT